MKTRYQRFSVWCGVAFFILFFAVCWPISRFIPPPSPLLTGAELVAMYADHLFRIRFGIALGYLAALLLVPWSAVIAIHMMRIEGRYPLMSLIAFGAGIANAVAFCIPFMFWAAVFYRPERSAELLQLLNDIVWLEFVMLYAPFVMQTLAIAVVGFSDKSKTPTFPRWFCFLSVWVSVLILPGGLAVFFKTGPFAWNGVFAFWVPVAAFTVYFASLVP
ncbi:MAG TPA: hypothetical protein VJS42_04460, partial [Steroidobacteraceae bacterium]|nr:hypothetical protein [Steroidobacteraceae bacterium]